MTLELVIQRADDLEEVYRRSFPMRLTYQLETMSCRLRVRDYSFPDTGPYQISLLVDGELIAQSRLTILLREEP
jgi:hypothetical protein